MSIDQQKQDDSPLVSVVIPAYNSEKFITEAIESALRQDYSPIEIIVVDDGSTDNTFDIASSFGNRVIVLQQANQGAAVARNLGIRKANGKYIAFLDADDIWWEHKISHQIAELQKTDYRIAYSRFIWWHPEGGQYSSADSEFAIDNNPRLSSHPIQPPTGWIYPELLLDCIMWTSTVIAEKSALESVDMFDPFLRKGQDYDFWLRLARNFKVLGVSQPTALYRMHDQNITHTVKDINYEYNILTNTITRWGVAAPDGRKLEPQLLSERLRLSCFRHGYAHLKHGDPKIALQSLIESAKYSKTNIKTFVLIALALLKYLSNIFK